MFARPRISAVGLFLALALAWCGGCSSPEVGYVAGRVTLDGAPLSGATIAFENAALGVSVNAPLEADGSFVLRTFDKGGLPPGEYQVAVRPVVFAGDETPLVGDAPPAGAAAQSVVPARYHSPATSGLSATVRLGENPPFQFELAGGS